MNLEETLSPYLRESGSHLVVALSGGVDSEVLLHLVHQYCRHHSQHQLSAIHIHHGLSPFADDWQAHCQARCDALGIHLTSVSVEVTGEGGIEASARTARYEALSSHAPAGSLVLLAQHADDQFETFLLQLKRGAGPKGLASMPVHFTDEHGQDYLRPLLSLSKQCIKDYAAENQLSWVEDDSNDDVRYDRNFLRKQVIPQLTQRWPHLSHTVSRSAQLCAQQQALLDEVLSERLGKLNGEQEGLSVDGLKKYSVNWQRQLIRQWLAQSQVKLPSQAVIDEMLKMLDAQDDANPVVQWEEWQLRRFDRQLFVLPVIEEPKNHTLAIDLGTSWSSLDGQTDFTIADIQETDRQSLCLGVDSGHIDIKFDQFSQRFKPLNVGHSKPLKQWFKQWKVPPWLRRRTPQIHLDGRLIALWVNNQWIVADEHRSKSGHFLQSAKNKN